MVGTAGRDDATERERSCEICGDRFVTGYFEGRKICLRCEQITIEKEKADRVIE